MKTLFKLMGIAVLSAGVCGCSALFRPTGDTETGSIALVLDTHATGTDTRAVALNGANLQISLSGDFIAEQTVTVSGSQAAVRFEGIPVGSSVRVRISGQTSDDRSFFYGNSSAVTIRKGQNTVAVPIEAKRSTPYILWNTQLLPLGVFATQTPENPDTQTSEPIVSFENPGDLVRFCFDNDANLYIITRISNGTNNELSLKKYEYSETDGSYTPEPVSRALTDLPSAVFNWYVTCDADNLYIATVSEAGDNLSPVALYRTPRKTALEASAKYEQIPIVVGSSAAVELTAITATDGTIYAAYDSKEEGTGFIIAAYGTDGTKKAEASAIAGILGLADADDIQISDLLVQDGVLYALISQADTTPISTSETGVSPQQYLYRSRGGVAKFSASNLTPDKSFGTKGILGWTTDGNKFESDTLNITGFWPTQDTAFYGPARFAAIKPKKLVVADDGAFIGKTDAGDGTCTQKNAIVEIDLGSAALSRTDVSVEFDRNISVSF